MQKPQMTSEKVHHRMDLLLALIELSVEFGVAGWVTYLQKEKGAPAGGAAAGLATRPRTTRRLLRWHTVMSRDRTASDSAGASVDYSGAGFNAGMGLEFTCDCQRRPSLDGSVNALRRLGLPTITQKLRTHYAVFTQRLRRHYAVITQTFSIHYADTDYAIITIQFHYAVITQ